MSLSSKGQKTVKFSIIIPAYNEEKYLGSTLETIVSRLAGFDHASEIVVVDNESTDRTAEIAAEFEARTIPETVHIIAKVRNTGARAATGDVLIFVDADTHIPAGLFDKIAVSMTNEKCYGGAVSVEYT